MGYSIREFPVKVLWHDESKVHIVRDSIRMLRDLLRIRKQVKKASRPISETK